jgi:ADP-heptose:LPS heptosyltransferase
MKKILIYRIGNLGDIICSMPAMVAIRDHFPNAWVGLLTNKETTGNPNAEEILKGNGFLSGIITYESEKISQPSYLWKLSKNFRKRNIDLLVYLALSKTTRKRLIRDWLFFSLSGCRKLVGFKLPTPLRSDIRGSKIPVYPQEVDRLMSLVAPLGIDTRNVNFRLPITETERKHVDDIWLKFNLANNLLIAVCPGAKFPVKRWPIDRFIQVILFLQKKCGAKIILVGGSFEKDEADEIMRKSEETVINLIGKTSYMESAEVLSRCRLLISNDCGPAHLAAAVGTPVVGIYSSRDFPGAWHPWGENHIVLRNDTLDCRFCFRTECDTMECIKSITVEQVTNACLPYLQ